MHCAGFCQEKRQPRAAFFTHVPSTLADGASATLGRLATPADVPGGVLRAWHATGQAQTAGSAALGLGSGCFGCGGVDFLGLGGKFLAELLDAASFDDAGLRARVKRVRFR